jgi:hypothetical protein
MTEVTTTISKEVVPLQDELQDELLAALPEYGWQHAWGPVNVVMEMYWGSVWGFLNRCEEANHRFTAGEVRELIHSTGNDGTWATTTKWMKSTNVMMRKVEY